MSAARWEARERREQSALGGRPDTDTRQSLPGSRACPPIPLTAPSTRLLCASFRARLGRSAARFLTRWDCVPTLTLARA